MPQMKFSLTERDSEFIKQHQHWGFPDKSSLIREALSEMRARLHQQRLRDSAKLYAEIYRDDRDLQHLTDQAQEGWPE